MAIAGRAAQFSLFAARTGLGDAVGETARVTDAKIELDESVKEERGKNFRALFGNIYFLLFSK